MTRRPLCLVCLFLMLAMILADWLGFPLIRGNPLPQEIQSWVEEHPESTVCGEVERYTVSEFSASVYLKNAYLIYRSEKVSIENVKVFLKEEEQVPVGTVILLSGNLERVPEIRNPGEFDSRQYYACEHIYYFLKKGKILKKSDDYSRYGQFLADLRERLAEALKQTAGNAAPVFQAMVLGDKGNLTEEIKLRYQMAGIVHIMAISGLHISILGVGLYQVLMRTGMGIWPSGILALAVMLQYGMMTGGSVSTMRAVCMFLISVGAKIAGRIYDMMTALAAAAMLILLEAPAYLYSSGFLLSFGAVLGIGIAAPSMLHLTGAKTKAGKGLVSSLAVQMVTLPVSLYFFGEVSLAGVFLNLAVLPTAGAVLGSGVGAALLGSVCVPAGAVAAVPGRLLMWGYEKLCAIAAGLPVCTWVGGRPEIWQIAAYYGILGAILWFDHGERFNRKAVRIFFFAGGIAVGILVLGYRSCPYMRITCLDVGQGDGIVVETPEDYSFVVDCGSSSKTGVGQYQLVPYLKYRGVSHLDGIFVSHTDEDHISGVRELLELMGKGLVSIRAECLYLPAWADAPEAWEELWNLAEKAGVRVRRVKQGDCLAEGKLKFCFLAPAPGTRGDDVNEDGMVLKLEYGSFCGIFTGDIGEETEKKLIKEDLLCDVDFLKVGHHGSRYSSSQEFLEKLKPEYGVISCSESNTYGHPSPEAVERLEGCGCQVEYTMKSGAVTLVTDGERIGMRGFLQEKSGW